MRKLIPSLCALIILLTACGPSYEEQAAKKLAARYGEPFTILELYPPKFGSGYYEVKACPTESPDLIFDAAIDLHDNNFSDEYIACIMGHEIAGLLRSDLPENLNCHVFGEITTPKPVWHSKDITLEEYMQFYPEPWVRLLVFVEDIDDVEDTVRSFLGRNSDWKIWCTIYEVTDEKLEEIKEYFKIEDTLGFDLKMELEINGTFLEIPE